MTTPPVTAPSGFLHAAVMYRSDQEFLSAIEPFVRGGLDADEPVLMAPLGDHERLLRQRFGADGVTVLDAGLYDRPASVIRFIRDTVHDLTASGAQRVRILGEVPHPGHGVPWGPWGRYEAAINDLLAGYPLCGLCPYDARNTPPDVLDDVLCTHPFRVESDGRYTPLDRFEDAASFLARQSFVPEDREAATVDVLNPALAEARQAVKEAARTARLDRGEGEELALAVNEALTNAAVHGRPPSRLRLWVGPERVVATVTDKGPGPADPMAGLAPSADMSLGGRGLWIIHQLCSEVSFGRTEDGSGISMVAGKTAP